MQINWTESKRKLSDLKPYERNPRTITKYAFEKLIESIKASGYHQRMLINADNTIIGGHQRLEALKQLGITEITVLVPDRQLTEQEFKRVLVTDNLAFGEFDMDIISSDFEPKDLLDWGFPEFDFKVDENLEPESSPEPSNTELCDKCPHK